MTDFPRVCTAHHIKPFAGVADGDATGNRARAFEIDRELARARLAESMGFPEIEDAFVEIDESRKARGLK